MDDDVLEYLLALKNVNDALIEALKLAVHILENEDNLSSERRQCSIQTIKSLIAQSEEIYSDIPISMKGDVGSKTTYQTSIIEIPSPDAQTTKT